MKGIELIIEGVVIISVLSIAKIVIGLILLVLIIFTIRGVQKKWDRSI